MTESGAPSDSPTIEQLDEATVEQIAAGEVVERPASVVKELIENSLDAAPSSIEIHVEGGGQDYLRVRDDGIGMSAADLRAAVKQHTTSKLRTLEDLQQGIGSYGFRGEALHAIGTVSRLEITSKPRTDATRGHRIRVEGGDVHGVEPAGCPVGTSVEVTDLFYNTPARREFLGTDETEFDHVNRIATHYALANTDVAVTLQHDGREVFRTPGRGNLEEAMLAIYGREVASAMISVDQSAETGPVTRVTGAVSDPETTRSRPRYLSTFVNDRYVRAKPIRDGIIEAYDRQLAADRYPFAVISCEIDETAVDVNVHPRKLEVRFEEPAAVKEAVREAIASTLRDADLLRSTAPRGSGRPPESNVTPDPTGPTTEHDNRESEPAESDPLTRGEAAPSDESIGQPPSNSRPAPSEAASGTDASIGEEPSPGSSTEEGPDLAQPVSSDRKFTGYQEQTTVAQAPTDPDFARLPPLTVLGQLHDTFIVAEGPDGLILIDQHAADERIAYEQLLDEVATDETRQQLMDPVTIELTSDEAAAYPQVAEALESLGFGTTEAGDDAICVESVPAVIDRPVPPERVRDAISAAVDEATDTDPVAAIAERVLADLACDPAVTGNTPLSEGSIVDLLTTLDACENPYECPHGRPVVIHIDEAELEERFERTYPGHTERRPE